MVGAALRLPFPSLEMARVAAEAHDGCRGSARGTVRLASEGKKARVGRATHAQRSGVIAAQQIGVGRQIDLKASKGWRQARQ